MRLPACRDSFINLALSDPSQGQGGVITVTVAGAPSDWTLSGGTNSATAHGWCKRTIPRG